MKFTAAVLALAAGASAFANNATTTGGSNVVYTTEVVTAVTTYCPEATTLTIGTSTITVTEATTLTIDIPCTIVRPVTTISSVVCNNNNCNPPAYHNSTGTATTVAPTQLPPAEQTPPTVSGTGNLPVPTTTGTPIETGGAGKVAAMSGAGLAGVLAFAALLL